MTRSRFWFIMLVSLVTAAVLLRLWRLPELFHFTYDEEVFAFVGKRMWVNGHIPLIGGVTPLHVHVAPYFYWFFGIVLGLGRLNPLVWGIAAAAAAAMTMTVLYVTGSRLFSNRVGMVAVFLSAFSFSQNVFDRHWWGITFGGLWALLALLGLHGILKGNKKAIWYLIPVFLLAVHADLSTLVVYLLTALVLGCAFFKPSLFRVKNETKMLIKKTGLVLVLVLIVSFIPLIIFDLRHDFSNIRGISQYIAEVQAGHRGNVPVNFGDTLLFLPRVLTRSLYVFGSTDLATQYSYCQQYARGKLEAVPTAATMAVTAMAVVAFWLGFRKGKNSGYLILLLLFTATYIGIVIYGIVFKGDLFDHYVVTLLPPFYLLSATLVDRFWHRRSLWVLVMILFAVVNLRQLTNANHRFGFADKIKAVNWAITTTGSTPISLDVIGDCFRYNGYRYLFYLYGKEPIKSYVDTNFTHFYDQPPAYTHPPTLVVITNPDAVETDSYWQEYNKLKSKVITSAKFGETEVLVVDNRQLDFVGKY